MSDPVEVPRAPLKFAIYGLVDPRDQKIYYVGCTMSRLATRLNGHRADVRAWQRGRDPSASEAKIEWLGELLAAGIDPTFRVLERVETHALGVEAERKWIEKLIEEGHPLTNGNKLPNMFTVLAKIVAAYDRGENIDALIEQVRAFL